MNVAQQCFGLSDEGSEDARHDSQATHRFVGIDPTREAAPDATRRLTFRRLLEKHELARRIFKTINAHRAECGLIMREETIVNATVIAAAPSTKKKRIVAFPRCISPRKARTGMSGCRRTPVLIRHRSGGVDERMVFGDVGYQGAAIALIAKE